jgi:hypothetical protein
MARRREAAAGLPRIADMLAVDGDFAPVEIFLRGHWEISIRVTTMWRFAMRSRSSIRVIRFTADAID